MKKVDVFSRLKDRLREKIVLPTNKKKIDKKKNDALSELKWKLKERLKEKGLKLNKDTDKITDEISDEIERLINGAIDYIERLVKNAPPYGLLLYTKEFKDTSIDKAYANIKQLEKNLNDIQKSFLCSEQTKFELRKYLAYKGYIFYQQVLFEFFPEEYLKIRTALLTKPEDILLHTENLQVVTVTNIVNNMDSTITRPVKRILKRHKIDFSKLKKKASLKNRRKSQLGSLFTKILIPSLYEYLRHFYKTPRHYLSASDAKRRYAYCPNELSKDISAILRSQHQDKNLTQKNIKAAAYRYIYSNKQSFKNQIKNILKYRIMTPKRAKKILVSLEKKKRIF